MIKRSICSKLKLKSTARSIIREMRCDIKALMQYAFLDRDLSDKDRAKHASRASGSRLLSVFGSPTGYVGIPIKFPRHRGQRGTPSVWRRSGMRRTRRENVIEPRPFKFNFKRVNNIKSFDYPARIPARSSNALYAARVAHCNLDHALDTFVRDKVEYRSRFRIIRAAGRRWNSEDVISLTPSNSGIQQYAKLSSFSSLVSSL